MLVGRKEEIKTLNSLYDKKESCFVAIYGRRRIGKTFLVRNCFENRITFEHTGTNSKLKEDQLIAFKNSLEDNGYFIDHKIEDWFEAFQHLKRYIETRNEKKKIIFIDELSWIDTKNSKFLVALETFWNGWCSKRKDILLIVCGSSASYILDKIIHNRGGLYNRLSAEINLRPFTLSEVEEYLLANQIHLDHKSIVDLYMCLGGVPYYYSFIEKRYSSSQYINHLFFERNAPLANEFTYLFQSLFTNYEEYLKIIQVLSKKRIGYNRNDLLEEMNAKSGSNITKKLSALASCGFIREYKKYGKKSKESFYQIIDNFTLFYYRFLKSKPTDTNFWINHLGSSSYRTWCGLSFEIVCLEHVDEIKKKLGISGVYTDTYAFQCKEDQEKGINGSQIDLLIDRADNIIDLCEIKYAKSTYNVTKDDAISIANKVDDFIRITNAKKSIHIILVTTFGLNQNAHSSDISYVITLDDLFSAR